MKKSLFTLTFLLSAFAAISQEVTIDHVTGGFEGVFPAEEGNIFYTYFISPKTGTKDKSNLEVYTFSTDLKPIDTATIEVSKNAYVMASNMSMNMYMFKIADPVKRSVATITYEMGKDVKSNTVQQNLPPEVFKPDYFMGIYRAMPEGFIVVSDETGKKGGIKVQCVDKEMKERWTKTIEPGKGDVDITDAYSIMERFMLLKKETNGKKVYSTLECIQADMGSDMFVNEMKDDKYTYIVTGMQPHLDLMGIAGYYYKNGNTDKKPEGIFFQMLGPAGDAMQNFKVPMEDLLKSVNNDIAVSLSSGKYKLYPHDLSRKPMGYIGIAELYTSEAVSGDATSFKVGDFLLFSFNEANMGPAPEPEPEPDPEHPELSQQKQKDSTTAAIDVRVIHKHKREALIKGEMANKSDMELADFLKSKNFFSYKGVTDEGVPRLLYRDDDSTGGKIYFLALEEPINTETLPPFELLFRGSSTDSAKKQEQKTDGNYVFETASAQEIPKYMYKGMIPQRGNKGLYYILRDEKLILWINNLL